MSRCTAWAWPSRDYDNDGRDDVYITALEGDRLFHNEGNGKFRDVTADRGIQNANFGTSAAWLDYDRDGKLDLFVANYVQWTREDRSVVLARREQRSPIARRSRTKARHRKLFHNLGDGSFEDVSQKAGPRRCDQQVAGRHGARLQRRRLARSLRRQRHAAQQAVPQQRQRHVHGRRHGGGSGVWRRRRGARRDGRRLRPITIVSGRPHLLVGNFSNQMLGALSQRRQRPVRG